MKEQGALRHLTAEIARLEREGLLRTPPKHSGGLVFCSNDYLGYATETLPALEARPPIGAGASRLVSGEHPAHAEAERAIADWLERDASLLFTSGYAANVGAISALARPGDLIVSDALNHASIIDGCRLSGARTVVVPHADAAAVERALEQGQSAARRWVITESYFSMDGDTPDLIRLRAACDRWDAALYVDEAHAVGVFGPAGRGVAAERGVVADVLVGTLGKALGLQGAFVAGSQTLRVWLWNRARSFVFSTGMSPTLAAVVARRVRQVAEDEVARQRLESIGMSIRAGLRQLIGDALLPSVGPIIPWLVGAPEEAVRISSELRQRGVLVQAIRPPTVPAGTSRLRVTAHARMSDGELDRFLEAVRLTLESGRQTT